MWSWKRDKSKANKPKVEVVRAPTKPLWPLPPQSKSGTSRQTLHIKDEKCFHCKKFLGEQEETISIGRRMFDRRYRGHRQIDFHLSCFNEIAGEEYIPEKPPYVEPFDDDESCDQSAPMTSP